MSLKRLLLAELRNSIITGLVPFRSDWDILIDCMEIFGRKMINVLNYSW